MSADFRDLILAMAKARPNSRVSTIVDLALAIENAKPDPSDRVAFGRWAANQPAIAELLAADKRIHAIKELRTLTRCSLAEAKYALDTVGTDAP